MAVKIRLTRLGDKKSPFYRIVVADARKTRDGEYLEKLGTYNPLTNPATIQINKERTDQWLKNGAQPTETTRSILIKEGILPEKKTAPKSDKKKKESK